MKSNVAAVVTALAVIAGTQGIGAQRASMILERVLVRVNGEIFTQSDLTQHQTDAVRERNQQEAVPEAQLRQVLAEVTPDILVDAVDQLLIAQYGRELGATFTDANFQDGIEGIKKENNMNDAQFKQALVQEGLTLEELRRNFERAYMLQTVQVREVLPRMRITEEELRQHYAANRNKFQTPATVTLRELTVLAPGQLTLEALSTEQATALRSKIDTLRQRALGGEDFAALVKEASESATKANGGLIGPVNLNDINPALKEVIGGLEPGGVSEPIPSGRGYQLLKLESRADVAQQPFEKIRDQIEMSIRNERLDGEMNKLKARLRAAAVIEWKDDTLRTIYERRLGERAALGQ